MCTNKYYIVKLNEKNEFNKLNNILKGENYKSIKLFYYDKPIIIDPQYKTFTNVETDTIKEIETVLKTKKAKIYNCTLSQIEKEFGNSLVK